MSVTATPKNRPRVKTKTPGVYKRGNRYEVGFRDAGQQHWRSFRTMAEAKTFKATIDAGAKPTSRERFGVYAERWLTEYRGRTAGGITEGTRDDYALHMRQHVIPWFDARGFKLGDVGRKDVRAFIEHLTTAQPPRRKPGARYSPATIRRIMVPLKAMMAEAYELELVASDVSRVRIVVDGAEGPKAPKTVTRDELERLLGELTGRDRLLFAFMYGTGLRIAEALGAQWQDYTTTEEGPVIRVRRQFYRGELRERAKTEAGRRDVAVMPSLASELNRHRAATEYADPTDPIFPALNGSHQDAHNVRRRLRKAVNAAGIEHCTPHTLRHSLATHLRAAGEDASVIQKVLGHTDEGFTRRTYIHVNEAPRFDHLDTVLRVVGAD